MKRWLAPVLWLLVVIIVGVAARFAFVYAARRAADRLPYHDHFATDGLKGWQSLGGAWLAGAGTVMNDSEERGSEAALRLKQLERLLAFCRCAGSRP